MRLPRFNAFLRDGRSSASNGITKQISRTNLKTYEAWPSFRGVFRFREPALSKSRAPPCGKLRELTRFSTLLAGLRGCMPTREHARTAYHVRKATTWKSLQIVLRSCRHRCGKRIFTIFFTALRELIKKKKKK